jgi:class 3 adenylate cyclase/predicted ATPase
VAADIREWLEGLGLGKYAEAFAENEVELRALPHLDQDDLKELGVALGHRKLILAAVAELAAAPSSVSMAQHRASAATDTTKTGDAERRQLTVMFCDLVGSTELSRRLDPEDLREVMRRYQDTVAGVVARFEGHVAKFLGDGVLAFFGWPRAYEDQAERAVRSGLAAIEAVANLKTEDGQVLEARVGIATGQVVIGDIVGEVATEADAVAGETPNLAARLLEVAAPGQVVTGATTRLLIGEALDLEDIGTHRLKGFAEPVAIWRVVGESTAETRFEAAHPGTRTRFVGREHELGLLKRAWQQAQAGIGQVVLISGEPGIGKSRLVDALSAELGDKARITLSCSPYHTNSALYPLIVHLERVLRWQREDSAEVKLTKLEEALQDFSLPPVEAIPLFAGLLSLPLPDDRYPTLNVTPQSQKQQTLDATVAWLLEEAERQPLLQVWEDLHWADPSTLELLALEIEQAPTAPILNVLTFRPEFQPPWPQRSHMTPLTLNRLERPEVEALITLQSGSKTLPEEVVEHIVGKTDGVPLYVEELTKTILEADFLRERNGNWELAGRLSEVAIPATLQDSLMARLDRLPTIREVAQVGAVLGREFAYEMVQAIVSIEETKLQEGLAQLVDAELLYQRGRPPRAKYIFKHALVQDAAYQSLLKRTRQYYHRQVAELIEARFPETVQAQPELVAHHYTAAGEADRAVDYWSKAGQRALVRSAYAEAVAHLSTGLDVLKPLAVSTERHQRELELHNGRALALQVTRGWTAPETGDAFAKARQLCRELGNPPLTFSVLRGLHNFHWIRAEHGIARDISHECLALAEQQDDGTAVILAHRLIGQALFMLGELTASRQHMERAIALYDPERHGASALVYGPDSRLHALAHLSQLLWVLGYPERACRAADEALSGAERQKFDLIAAMHYGLFTRLLRREHRAVLKGAKMVAALAREHGVGAFVLVTEVLGHWARLAISKRGEDIDPFADSINAKRANGDERITALHLGALAEALATIGRVEEALATIAEALELTERTGERWSEAELHRLGGQILLMRDGLDTTGEAEACFRRSLDIGRRQSAKSWELRTATNLARLWRDQGKPTEAHDLLAPVYDWFTEGFDIADLKDAEALLDELR